MTTNTVIYLFVINALSVAAFAWDKHCAMNGLWRLSERTLLTFAIVGGSVGALFATQILRHKSQKQPFKTILRLIFAVQIIALIGFCLYPAQALFLQVLQS